MKTVAIYFNQPGKHDYPFDDQGYFQSYQQFSGYCAERDIAIVFVRDDSYIGNMTFTNGWRFNEDVLEDINDTIKADLIYLKNKRTLITSPNDLIINDPDFVALAGNKWQAYQLLKTYMPPTYLIDDQNWQDVIQVITTNKVVLKPVAGSGGEGIIIADKDGFDFPSLNITTPYIAQEFIDTSAGIPNLCQGAHDLRIIMRNNQPALSFIRTPKSGSFLSNIAQGGSLRVIDIDQIPLSIIEMAKDIDQHFIQYSHRFYSSDFFVKNGQPYLVEINSMPGFPTTQIEDEEYRDKYYHSLYTLFAEAITANEAKGKE